MTNLKQNYVLRDHSGRDQVAVWDDFDYSRPQTKLIKYLKSGTKVKIIFKKFPGILVELDHIRYWICEWDIQEIK